MVNTVNATAKTKLQSIDNSLVLNFFLNPILLQTCFAVLS